MQPYDVEIRILGDFAVLHGRLTFNDFDGNPGRARYPPDTWARRDGAWVCISADVVA